MRAAGQFSGVVTGLLKLLKLIEVLASVVMLDEAQIAAESSPEHYILQLCLESWQCDSRLRLAELTPIQELSEGPPVPSSHCDWSDVGRVVPELSRRSIELNRPILGYLSGQDERHDRRTIDLLMDGQRGRDILPSLTCFITIMHCLHMLWRLELYDKHTICQYPTYRIPLQYHPETYPCLLAFHSAAILASWSLTLAGSLYLRKPEYIIKSFAT